MGEVIALVAILTFFGFLGAIILGPIWLRERTKQSAHKLISQSIEKGQQLDPALIERLTAAAQSARAPDQARRTLGSGVVMLALAGGFVAAAYVSGDWGFGGGGMLVPAAILGALGVAFTLLGIFDYATKKKTEE